MESALQITSARPYFIRAVHEWCTDNGLTPYIVVKVTDGVRVPREYVNNGEIVLNISYDATAPLKLGNEFVEFKARFGGVPREIVVPVECVMAIYARENGQGMGFPALAPGAAEAPPQQPSTTQNTDQAAATPATPPRAGPQLAPVPSAEAADDDAPGDDTPPPPKGRRPALKRVK